MKPVASSAVVQDQDKSSATTNFKSAEATCINFQTTAQDGAGASGHQESVVILNITKVFDAAFLVKVMSPLITSKLCQKLAETCSST